MLDRFFVLYQFPIATQEFIQFLLWAFVLTDDDLVNNGVPQDCSSLNRTLNYILMIVVNCVPFGLYTIMLCGSVGTYQCKGVSNK